MSEEKDLIKLHITMKEGGGESCWAERLSPTTARIDNVPFTHTEFGFNDIVEFVDQGEGGYYEFTKVIEHKTKTIGFRYEVKEGEEIKAVYGKLHGYFEKEKNVAMEGLMAGMAVIAIPYDMEDRALIEMMEAAPVATAPL